MDATTGWVCGDDRTILKRTGAWMLTGTYTGDGTDNRPITGLGFQPDVVIVKSEKTSRAIHPHVDDGG